MIERIIRAVKSYIMILNMRTEAIRISEKISQSKRMERDTPLWIHILLFAATLVTTTLAGAHSADSVGEIIISGLPFSMTIIVILLSHEMGHYLAARHFGVKATLPYFIPFPSIIGTMGAVIKIKSRIQDKRALFYIGAMGPLVGFLLSLIASIVGIYLSEIKPLPSITGDVTIPIFGDSILFSMITSIIHGKIPAGHDIFLSSYAWAGWIGFLVTSLNLMPMGQLDGSHILYSLIGDKQLLAGWSTFVGLIILSFVWAGWIIWIIMALLFLMIGHPPVDEGEPLSLKERMVGWSCILIFIITFIPVPVTFLSGLEDDVGVFPIKCDFCEVGLEPSGITVLKGRLFIVSDNDCDCAIYELTKGSGVYNTKEFLNLTDSFKMIKRIKQNELDLEGIVAYKDGFFVVDERDRYIYRIELDSSIRRIDHDILAYCKRNMLRFSLNKNAGFEGIAVDPDKMVFFIANERDDAIVFMLKMKGDILTTFYHIAMDEILVNENNDISDLFFDKGYLYLINRKGRRIIKLNPYKKIVLDTLSYSKATKGLYSSKKSGRVAEGLSLTEKNILLILDSNGKRMKGRRYGKHGAFIVMKRPDGF